MKVISSINGNKYEVLNTDTGDCQSSSLKNLISSDEEILGLIKNYNIAFSYYDAISLYKDLKAYVARNIIIRGIKLNKFVDLTDIIDKFLMNIGRKPLTLTKDDVSGFYNADIYKEFLCVYNDKHYFKASHHDDMYFSLNSEDYNNYLKFISSNDCKRFGLRFIFNLDINFAATIKRFSGKSVIKRVLLDVYNSNKLISKLDLDSYINLVDTYKKDYFIKGIFYDNTCDDFYYLIGCFDKKIGHFKLCYIYLYFKDFLDSKLNIIVKDIK